MSICPLTAATHVHHALDLRINYVQGQIAPLQGQVASALSDLKTKLDDLAALQQQEAKLRADLAASPMAADAAKLAKDLGILLAKQRKAQADLLEARDAAEIAQKNLARWESILARVGKQLGEAAKEKTAATTRDEEETVWLGALPPAAFFTEVTGLDSSTNAHDKLVGMIGVDLLALALARAAVARARIASRATVLSSVATKLDALDASNAGATGAISGLRTAYEAARRNVREAALLSSERLDRAKRLLDNVAKASVLTQPEIEAINAFASKAPATTAAQLLKIVFEKEKAYEEATAVVTAKTVLGETPTQAESDTQTTAGKELQDARKDFVDHHANVPSDFSSTQAYVDAWELTVPDAVWQLIRDFEEAKAILAQLTAWGNATPTLAKTFTDARASLAAKMQDVFDVDLKAQALRGEHFEGVELESATDRERISSAIRGDA